MNILKKRNWTFYLIEFVAFTVAFFLINWLWQEPVCVDANLPNPAPAVELAAGFTVCHCVFGVVNYL